MIYTQKLLSRVTAFSASVVLLAAVALPVANAAQSVTGQATVSTTILDTMTFSLASSTIALGNLTPGSPVTSTVTAQMSGNSQAGFTLEIKRDGAATLTHSDGTTTIADKTAWDPTASSGSGNGAAWTGTGLAFRINSGSTTAGGYNSTWWGANDAGNAKFAGLPGTYTQVLNETVYGSGQKNVQLDLRLDVPTNQKSGAYTGTFTLRAQSAV